MRKSIVVTTRLDLELAARFDALAAHTGRSRAALLTEAARLYAEEQAAFHTFMDAGDRDIDEGRFLDADGTRGWLRAIRDDAEARIDQPRAA